MSGIELKHVYKEYENGFTAVKDFQLEIKEKEFVIFVGPSGCGKSTTLRMIADLRMCPRARYAWTEKSSTKYSPVTGTWRWSSRIMRCIHI